jgi:GrpB-like predicted nucleotidyltransferase (UPF0157 family)
MVDHPVCMVPYREEWPRQFTIIGTVLRKILGEKAIRIDHIGSTSVKGLTAKPIIDVQMSVASFEPLREIVEPIEQLGYEFRPNNDDLTKRYFRSEDVHIHVRIVGSWSEQFSLLFRDYLRTHPKDAEAYGVLKVQLAKDFGADRIGYTEAKSNFIFETIQKAHVWSMETGWSPGSSDA